MTKQHKTIPFDPKAHLEKSLSDTAFKAAYDELEEEFSALDASLKHVGWAKRSDAQHQKQNRRG